MNCKPRVEAALRSTPGAKDVQVDFANKKATVAFDNKGHDSQSLIASLRKAGYGGKVLR